MLFQGEVKYLNLINYHSQGLSIYLGSLSMQFQIMVSQPMLLSQYSKQSSQIVGFRYQISPSSSSPNNQNMQKIDQVSHKTINIYNSIK